MSSKKLRPWDKVEIRAVEHPELGTITTLGTVVSVGRETVVVNIPALGQRVVKRTEVRPWQSLAWRNMQMRGVR